MTRTLETVFNDLCPQDQRVLFAALFAAQDVHAPLDTLPAGDHERIAALCGTLNDLIKPDGLVQPPAPPSAGPCPETPTSGP